jgi:hypothetical protein
MQRPASAGERRLQYNGDILARELVRIDGSIFGTPRGSDWPPYADVRKPRSSDQWRVQTVSAVNNCAPSNKGRNSRPVKRTVLGPFRDNCNGISPGNTREGIVRELGIAQEWCCYRCRDWVAGGDRATPILKLPDDIDRRRLPHVVGARFERQAEDCDPSLACYSIEGLLYSRNESRPLKAVNLKGGF